MEDSTIKAVVVVVCATVAYCTYVAVTQADGLVFGTFIGLLAAVGGYVIGKGQT